MANVFMSYALGIYFYPNVICFPGIGDNKTLISFYWCHIPKLLVILHYAAHGNHA